MNETHEKRTTQPFGTFFNLIYTVALLISRLLHPVSVKGLENLPRNGALLMRQPFQQLGSDFAGHRSAAGLPAPGHGQGGAVPLSRGVAGSSGWEARSL